MTKPLWGIGTPRLSSRRFSFRFQLRKQNAVADAFLAEQHHAQAVNAHAVFERDQKILVQLLLLTPAKGEECEASLR